MISRMTSFPHCLQRAATRCNTLQHAATRCNTLQHAATHCTTLHHTAPTATHCNAPQHTCNTLLTPCNTLQHPATPCRHCNALQHTTMICNAPQHTATHTHCNPLSQVTSLGALYTSLLRLVAATPEAVVAETRGVLQCVAVCCSELQCNMSRHMLRKLQLYTQQSTSHANKFCIKRLFGPQKSPIKKTIFCKRDLQL